jgi:hypothetical protein
MVVCCMTRVAHRWSHRSLLVSPPAAEPGDVAALVVPTSRKPAAMRDVLRLGAQIDRPVVALCSQWSDADEVVEQARRIKAAVVAVDVTKAARLPLFQCDALLRHAGLDRSSDVSAKRNLGLALARRLGWKRLLFLDDDITDLNPDAVAAAGGLLRTHRHAALENVGYPDNSVVCHARREVGLDQDTFVGGGALAVRVDGLTPFFPTIYNEDWFFLAGRRQTERIALCGKVSQREYDPYLTPERARSEEFGDYLAEGLFAFAGPARAADEEYWRAFRDERVAMIGEILRRARGQRPSDRRDRMIEALTAARARHRIIDPAFGPRWLRTWQDDLATWQRFLGRQTLGVEPVTVFEHLGLRARTHRP